MLGIGEITKGALKNLKGNKVRSFLTMLGIIIGISSVITMSSLGKGGQESITGDLKAGGYGKYTVSVDTTDDNFRWKYLISDDLIEQLKSTNRFKNISPDLTDRMTLMINKRREFLYLEVSTPEYEDIEPVTILSGRNFLPMDYSSGERNIVIDNLTAQQMYGSNQNALGKQIEVKKGKKGKSVLYTIIGVMKNPIEEMAKMMSGSRIPRYGRVPLKTYMKSYGDTDSANSTGYMKIVVDSLNPDMVAESMKEMKEILGIITGSSDLYEINVSNSGAESFDKILSTLNIFISFVAGISLFVGGIGVMNIMLVSVIERTKEIGIRKAIGATNRNILTQFLMESVILTGVGGILGLLIGIGFALAIGAVIGIAPIFTVFSVVFSLGVSTLIGILFGVAPAKKASQLNPIDALRAE